MSESQENTLVQAARAWMANRLYFTMGGPRSRRVAQYRYHKNTPLKGRVATAYSRAIRARFGNDVSAFSNWAMEYWGIRVRVKR